MNLFVGRACAGASTNSAVMMTVGGWEKVNRFWVIRGKLSTLAYSSYLQLYTLMMCGYCFYGAQRVDTPPDIVPPPPPYARQEFVFRVVVSPTPPLFNNDWDLLSLQPSMAYRSSAPKGVLLIRPLLNLCTGNGRGWVMVKRSEKSSNKINTLSSS